MGSCCWRMMMVTQSTITLILGIIVHNTVAESLRESFLNTLLNDFSNTFEPEYQGDSVDYNAMMNQYDDDAVDMDKGMFKPEPVENTKPTGKDSGKHVKGGVLPAYCDPPNPCPKGYTAEDGCIEMDDFQNKAEFSRKYQASQSCMCDSEHMFSCPDIYHQEDDMPLFGVSNFEDINNPFLSGAKLPIAAKKGMGY